MSDMTLLRDVRRRKRARKPMTKRQRRRMASLLLRRERLQSRIELLPGVRYFGEHVARAGYRGQPLFERRDRIDGELVNLRKSIEAN